MLDKITKNIKYYLVIGLIFIAILVKIPNQNKESFVVETSILASSPVQSAQIDRSNNTSNILEDRTKQIVKLSSDLVTKSKTATDMTIDTRNKADKLVEDSNGILDHANIITQKGQVLNQNILAANEGIEKSLQQLIIQPNEVIAPKILATNPADETIFVNTMDGKYIQPARIKPEEGEFRSKLDIISEKERNAIELRKTDALETSRNKNPIVDLNGKWSEISLGNVEFITGHFSDIMGINYNKYGFENVAKLIKDAKEVFVDFLKLSTTKNYLQTPNNKVYMPYRYMNNGYKQVAVLGVDTPIHTVSDDELINSIKEMPNVETNINAKWIHFNSPTK